MNRPYKINQIIAESPAAGELALALEQIMAESSAIVESIRTNLPMRRQLASMKRKIARMADSEDLKERIIVGTTTGATISFAAGYVIWLCRGGSLLASVLAAMPMWKWFDPLPVLAHWVNDREKRRSGKKKASAKHSDDEDAEALFDDSEGQA